MFFHNCMYPILLLLTEVSKSSFPLYASFGAANRLRSKNYEVLPDEGMTVTMAQWRKMVFYLRIFHLLNVISSFFLGKTSFKDAKFML